MDKNKKWIGIVFRIIKIIANALLGKSRRKGNGMDRDD